MAAPRFPDIADLNEFGLPRHGEGVGPTLRPDIIAERHRHDWDTHPAAEPLAFAAAPDSVAVEIGLGAQRRADDLLHRARMTALGPEAADFRETATHENPVGDNEQQGARRAHAMAQGNEGQGSTEGV